MSTSRSTSRRFAFHITIGLIALAALVAISPGIGSQDVGVSDAWRHWSDTESRIHVIAFQLRLPRALKALVAGFTLALAGAVYQTLFRNVLATPYTLGIAGGGSLGALIAIKCGFDAVVLGYSGDVWCSFLGAAAVVSLVFLMARSRRHISGNTLILGGVTIGLFCSAMMMFVTYLADVRETFFIVRWMMGSLEAIGNQRVVGMLIPLCVSWGVLLWHARALNQFDVGDEVAASRGVNPAVVQILCVAFASLATACVVSICGPIGFVGLIVPQAVRLVVGRDHRILLPVAAIWGGAFLIVCDWLSRVLPVWYGAFAGHDFGAFPLPIGVMTAVLGAPVFIVLLWRSGGE